MATRKSSRTAKGRRSSRHSVATFGSNGTTRRSPRRNGRSKSSKRSAQTAIRHNKPFAVKVNGKKTTVASAWFFGG
jgi:hypothetical protein